MDGAAHNTEQQIEQQLEATKPTKLAPCYRSAGGCGIHFRVPVDEPVPSRCPACRGGRRRVEKQGVRGRAYDCDSCGDEFRYAMNDDEGSGLTKGSPSPVGALFTVRIGQLAIDCHSVEAVDALVQRYGAAS